VSPLVKDQELRPYDNKLWVTPIYWEGANDVRNKDDKDTGGKAYVELNGFCPRF